VITLRLRLLEYGIDEIPGKANKRQQNKLMLMQPNGLRYPRVGGTRERHFAGTNFKPHNLLENAATPTRRVHAVLAGFRLLILNPKEIIR
jgi:hypothetical protein